MRVGTTVRVIWVWVLLTAIQRNTRAGYVKEAKVRAGACKGIINSLASTGWLEAGNHLSLDVTTACHLGKCIAIRTSEAVPLVNESLNDGNKFSGTSIERALRISNLGKANAKENVILQSKRGAGGNTTPYRCIIIKQSEISQEVMELLRIGK